MTSMISPVYVGAGPLSQATQPDRDIAHHRLFVSSLSCRRVLWWASLWFSAVSFSAPSAAAEITTEFTFIPSSMEGDDRTPYDLMALRLSLSKTVEEYGPFRLTLAPAMSKERALERLKSNYYKNAFRIFFPSTDFNTHKELAKVNFPVHLGLFSHRVCFVPKSLSAEVAQISTKKQLQQYVFGMGYGWEEKPIFEANRLKVTEVRQYDSLFKMTAAGRLHFFCRAIHEIHEESQRFQDLDTLTVDQNLSIHYPLPLLFFTGHQNSLAVKRLTLGFTKAFEDGSLLALWLSEYEDKIKDIHLEKRRSFFLPNPLLDELDFDYEQYFYIKLPAH